MVSESEFTVKGHGVHTSYIELTNALKQRDDIDVIVNQDQLDIDITHIQTMGFYAIGKLLFGHGKKVVSAHLVPASFVGSIVAAKYWKPLARIYLKLFYMRADMIFAVSKMVKHELENDMGIKKPIKILYNTVDMSRYKRDPSIKKAARSSLDISETDFVIVGNGQVQPRKRFDMFVEVAKQLPEVSFTWIGGIPFQKLGAEYDRMNKLIENVPNNVVVTGLIELDKVRDYVRSADVFFLPAEQENHPLCVLEAAGAGLPIILRDIPEYNDTFKGDVIMIKSIEQAKIAIIRLRDDKEYYKESSQAAGRIASRFDSKSGAELAVKFYKSLL